MQSQLDGVLHHSAIKWSLNYSAQKNIDKIVADLFAFRHQKCSVCKLKLYAGGRATEILKSKSVHSTNDVIDVIRTCVRQSQKVTKTHHFHP